MVSRLTITSKDFMNNFLKELRSLIDDAEKEMSIREIARRCGVTHPTILYIKSDNPKSISLDTYIKIKQGLSGESYAE